MDNIEEENYILKDLNITFQEKLRETQIEMELRNKPNIRYQLDDIEEFQQFQNQSKYS